MISKFKLTHDSIDDLSSFVPSYIIPGDHTYLCTAEEQRSRKSPGDDWKYHINQYRYRSKWALTQNNLKIGFFGCSFTFGEGVAEEHIFSNIAGYAFPKTVPINLGMLGISIKWISKVLQSSVQHINFDTVVLTLPAYNRYMLVGDDGNIINLLSHSDYNDNFMVKFRQLYSAFSSIDFQHQTYDDILLMSMVLKQRNITAVWSSWDPTTAQILKTIVPAEHIIEPMTHYESEYARDGLHPGPKAHQRHATNIVNNLVARGKYPRK